jgi:hypothetical protein
MSAFASLSRGVKIFLAVDLVLVLGLVVAAVVVLGGGSDGPAPTAGSTQGAGTSAAVAPAGTPAATSSEPQSFASPTGNIACTMSVDGVTCSIAHTTVAPPVVEGCTGTTGHVVMLNAADGVSTPCVDGPAPVAASADTPVLEYGSEQSVGPYTCSSASNGMTCVVEGSGVGFRLATAELATLP